MSYLWLTISLLTASSAPVTLGTNITKVSERASNQIQCIMQQQNLRYQLSYLPWRRAKHEVKQQRLDGYFTAIADAEVEQYATLSAPLFLENWYWFWRQGDPQRSNDSIRFGAVLGSHQADWFNANGYNLEVEVNSLEQLVQLLALQRIDMLLADQEDFSLVQQNLKFSEQQFSKRLFRYVALGVYFADNFLELQPGFLASFNQQVHRCASNPFALSPNEQQKITELLLSTVTELSNRADIKAAVNAQNQQNPALDTILLRDQQWITEVTEQQTGVAEIMQNSALSQTLSNWQQNFGGLISEIILTDNQGANIAISAITSDYWQGDEIKFLSVFQQAHPFYLGPVEYDQSTQRFLVHLSVPVLNQQQHIGAIIVGIDIEKALTERN